MGAWCDPHKGDCSKRNFWGNHNLTDPDSEPTSYYPAWYKAVADAVTSVPAPYNIYVTFVCRICM